MKSSGLEKAFETVYGKTKWPICFLGNPFLGHFDVITLPIQLFRWNLSSIYFQKQQVASKKRLLGIQQIKTFQMRPLLHFENHSSDDLKPYVIPLVNPTNLQQSLAFAKLKERVDTLQGYLILEWRTAKLWGQRISYIDFIKMFRWAERAWSWNEHLAIIEKMLNLYTATSHFS